MKSNRTKSHVNYTPITSSGELLLPGRHVCNCEATKHALINNCLNCGRIVCEQEGAGPCFTCGELVCILNFLRIHIHKISIAYLFFIK